MGLPPLPSSVLLPHTLVLARMHMWKCFVVDLLLLLLLTEELLCLLGATNMCKVGQEQGVLPFPVKAIVPPIMDADWMALREGLPMELSA